MNAASLGDVVRGLFLRVVGDVAGHGGRDDKGSCAALLEMGSHCLGAVGCPAEVGLDNAIPFFLGVVEESAVCCGAGTVVDVSLCSMTQRLDNKTYLAIKASIFPKSLMTSLTRRWQSE